MLSDNEYDVWEVRIRLINAIAYLLASAGVLLIGVILAWLVRGA